MFAVPFFSAVFLAQQIAGTMPGPWAPGEAPRIESVDAPVPAFPTAEVESALTALALRPPAEPGWLDAFTRRLNEAARADQVVGLAAAVIENNQVVLTYTYGETDAGGREQVTTDTAFRAASLSKTFTGTLLSILHTRGIVNLNAAVPDTVLQLKSGEEITWLQLLSHQTGLPNNAYDNLIEAGRDPDRVRERLADVDQICGVGACYSYQNVAFAQARVLIEQATGMSYEQALRTYLFEPYGLDHASVGTDQLRESESWARPHRGWRRSVDRAGRPDTPYDGLPAAAGVNLTLNDLIAWARAHLAMSGGVPHEARNFAWTPRVNSLRETVRLGAVRARVDETGYGMGWRIYSWGDRTLIMHSGSLSGYGAQIVLEPETGFAYVALWNADARAPWRLWPTAMDLRTGDGPGDWLDDLDG